MKKIFCIITLISFSRQLLGQTNLVPNPSFETYTNCPNSSDQMNRAIGWSSFRESPDYFNTCSTISGIKPPYSTYGFQYPQDGNAYAGFTTYDNTGFGPNFREIMGAKLTNTLNIGVKYYFSFFVNLAGGYNFTLATNKIGLRFSKVSYSYTNPVPINNLAHYYCINKITDTLNWTKLQGSFVADSAYQYIMFGNFFNDVNTDTLGIGPQPANQYGFYYIDNVCVSTDSNQCYLTTEIEEINEESTIIVFPNPSSDFISIKLSHLTKISEFKLVDRFGQIIISKFVVNTDKIDLNNISDGLYFVQLISDGKTYYDKIIVRH